MKSITALGIGLASVVVSVFASSNVLAAATVYGGSSCHNLEGKDAGNVEFYEHGATNASNISSKLICPLVKHTNDFNGLTVRVNFDSRGANTVTCTLYSRNWNGSSLGSKTVKNKRSGKESLTIRVPTSTTRSYFSLICNLPPKEVSEIFSVEVLN